MHAASCIAHPASTEQQQVQSAPRIALMPERSGPVLAPSLPINHSSKPAKNQPPGLTEIGWSSLSNLSTWDGRYVPFCRCAQRQKRCLSRGTPISSATSRRSSLKGALRAILKVRTCRGREGMNAWDGVCQTNFTENIVAGASDLPMLPTSSSGEQHGGSVRRMSCAGSPARPAAPTMPAASCPCLAKACLVVVYKVEEARRADLARQVGIGGHPHQRVQVRLRLLLLTSLLLLLLRLQARTRPGEGHWQVSHEQLAPAPALPNAASLRLPGSHTTQAALLPAVPNIALRSAMLARSSSALGGGAHLEARAHVVADVLLRHVAHHSAPLALPHVHQHVGIGVLGEAEVAKACGSAQRHRGRDHVWAGEPHRQAGRGVRVHASAGRQRRRLHHRQLPPGGKHSCKAQPCGKRP